MKLRYLVSAMDAYAQIEHDCSVVVEGFDGAAVNVLVTYKDSGGESRYQIVDVEAFNGRPMVMVMAEVPIMVSAIPFAVLAVMLES